MKKALTYGAGLIATYLVVANATGFGKAINAVGGQAVAVGKMFQGR